MSSLILSIDTNKHYLKAKSFTLEYKTSSKFRKDKVNFENDDYYILLDGIVLNKKQLLEKSPIENWTKYLINSYEIHGDVFFKNLKGSYYGFIYDKKECKWIIFTDHISSKPMYYYQENNNLVFSNSYNDLIDYLKKNNVSITLNEQGAYLLLSYGYLFEDITITNEIKRIMVGYYAMLENNHLIHKKFYQLNNKPIEISEEDAIEGIDKHFRDAVQLAFEKDIEYGYKHAACLSGGLDSRMTVCVAHDLGYTNQLNLTFSQSNYLDETTPKKIAADLKHEWLFKALDNGNFMKNIDETTKVSGGNTLYFGLAHALSLYDYVNFDNLGIIHTGQLGDVAISTFYTSLDQDKQFSFGDGAYSTKILSEIASFNFKEDYPNEEIFKMYIRGFYGANQGSLAELKHSETYSPFYHLDFLEFALSIPVELRFDNYLYKKWIIAKYPLAASYIWERIKVPITYPYWIKVKGKKIPFKLFVMKVMSKLGISDFGTNTKSHMNPLKYWLKTNLGLKEYFDEYFNQHIYLLDDYPMIKKSCINLYSENKNAEIAQVITLLSAIKSFK